LVWVLFPATQAPSDPVGFGVLADAPDAEELAFFEELSDWIREDAQITAREAIHDRSSSFDFFCSYHDEDLRNEVLVDFPFGDAIARAASRYDLDPLLVAAVIEAESGFDPAATSRQGALGLMQVMPATVRASDVERLHDPDTNIELGARYLRRLLERYSGDLELTLAAYNAGPANVRRYGGVPPFRETQRYVEKVLGLYIEHHREIWRSTEAGQMLAAG